MDFTLSVMYNTLSTSSNIPAPYSRDYFKKLMRWGIKGFMILTLPDEAQQRSLLQCLVGSRVTRQIVTDGRARQSLEKLSGLDRS